MQLIGRCLFLYSDSIDFIKGIKSLSNLISINYPNSNLTDSLFIFFSKDKKQVRILEIEEDDIWLYQNRLNFAISLNYLISVYLEFKF